MIIVIDGPAGSGKSSTAKAIAQKLGIEYLDSGALYRTLTLIYIREGKDVTSFFDALKDQNISFEYSNEMFQVYINNENVTRELRSLEVTEHVSLVASMPDSRKFVNKLMRDAVQQGKYIAEGRDLGTAVFPEADLKFFMSADIRERIRRRYDELREAGRQVTLKEVEQNILKRDIKDSQRRAAPLKKAEDAIEIDTTNLSFEQQVQQICTIINNEMDLSITQ